MSDYDDKTPTRGRGSRPPALPRTFEELQARAIEQETELRIFKRETRGQLNAGAGSMAELRQGVKEAKEAAAKAVEIATAPRKLPAWLATATLTLGLAAAGALWRLSRYPDDGTFAHAQERLRQLELKGVQVDGQLKLHGLLLDLSRSAAPSSAPPAPPPAPVADPLGRTKPRGRR